MTSPEELTPDTFPVNDQTMKALHRRLERRAPEDGVVDISYRTLETPLGRLMLAATTDGLLRVAFENEGFDAVLGALAGSVSPRILEAPAALDAPAREIDEYFVGRRRTFDLRLDRTLSHGFRGEVHEYLPRIGYGETLSYKDLAQRVGNPRAVRAVGSACATNPLPVVVPCHRVLRTDGALGGYVGGLEAKSALLELEASA